MSMEQEELERLIDKLYNSLKQLEMLITKEKYNEIYAKVYKIVEDFNHVRMLRYISK